MINPSTQRITLALLLSLAVHGLVVMLWDDKPHVLQAGGQAMTVSLVVHASKPQLTPEKKPAPEEKVEESLTERKNKAIQETPDTPAAIETVFVQQVIEPVMTHVQTTTVTPTKATNRQEAVQHSERAVTTAAITETTSQQLKVVLRKAFNANFYYPRQAIRRGWQGEVKLGLHISASGRLTKIRVLQASGYELLDKAAINSLNKVEILPGAIAMLNGQSLDLILPVEYRLL